MCSSISVGRLSRPDSFDLLGRISAISEDSVRDVLMIKMLLLEKMRERNARGRGRFAPKGDVIRKS